MTSERNYKILLEHFAKKYRVAEWHKYHHEIMINKNIRYFMQLVGSYIQFTIMYDREIICNYSFNSFEIHLGHIEVFTQDYYSGTINLP